MVLTLECLLSDTTSEPFKAFSAYLQQQYCTENLMFWLAVEQYKEEYQQQHQQRRQQCMVIIYTYIQPNSCREINIPCDMRHAIIDKVGTDYHHPDLFIPASEAVLELMRSNSFIPWLTQYDPSMLPTPPTPISSKSSTSSLNSSSSPPPPPTSSAMISSLSSPDGWNILTTSPTSSPRPSVSSFRSTNDIVSSTCSSKQYQQHQRRVGGLSYQSMLKRMKKSFFFNTSVKSPSSNPIRRSSLTWPSTISRKK